MYFEYPELLWLLVVPALLVLHYIWLELAERHPHIAHNYNITLLHLKMLTYILAIQFSQTPKHWLSKLYRK